MSTMWCTVSQGSPPCTSSHPSTPLYGLLICHKWNGRWAVVPVIQPDPCGSALHCVMHQRHAVTVVHSNSLRQAASDRTHAGRDRREWSVSRGSSFRCYQGFSSYQSVLTPGMVTHQICADRIFTQINPGCVSSDQLPNV